MLAVFWTISYIVAHKEKNVSIGFWINELAFAGVRPIVDNILSLSFAKTDGIPKSKFEKTWAIIFKYLWCLNIKYVLPTSLTWITYWAFKLDIDNGYGNYPKWLNYLGIAFVFVGMLCVVIPAFFPYKGDTVMNKPEAA